MEPLCKKLKTNDSSGKVNVIESYDVERCDTNLQFDKHKNVTRLKTYEAVKDEDSVLLTNEDEDSFVFPPDDDISDMLEDIDYNGSLPTITERYFSTYYKVNVQRPEDDMCIRIHSNRICMISIAPSHTIFQNGKKILKVDYKVSDKLDRMLNKVSGKSKHGAQPLQANSNICTISCSDGQTYTIKCCMIGKLIEVNEILLHNPELLKEPPHKGGYLALVLPNLKLLDKMKDTLLTPEQYKEYVLSRVKTESL
ncbi:hypothetical protein KPH14_004961 [Odynerus spinipes]|uniref:Actin-binding transcription modulator n=1 Tax=Odynerus spinipes TaxID=1348599 RepID=A0AAD9RN01_9HYME|nr:hypothetical protein KPH14_004961 [Odynerus spinipes]